MSATAYGGIRAGGRASAGITLGGATPGAQAAAMPQPGSPYVAAAPFRQAAPMTVSNTLLVLVGLEVLALLALRHGFRFNHGG